MEALQRLTPRDPEKGLLQLIPYEQLTMRGEDLTGLIFAQFPTVGKTEENRGEAQQEEGSYPKQMESSPTVHKERYVEYLAHANTHYNALQQPESKQECSALFREFVLELCMK